MVPCIIYADPEYFIKEVDGCENNPEKLSTAKVGEHILCGYSMYMIQAFDCVGNKHDIYKGENSKKMFCESLSKHALEIINFEKKENHIINKRRL